MGRRASTLRLGDLTVEGVSRAGEETWLRVRPPGLAFDVGRGATALAGAGDLFLSHGHLDHALGLPYVLSMRTLQREAATRVFCPSPIADELEALVAAAARLERVEYRYEILPLDPGERVEVGRDLAVEAFATDHVVPSLGFHLLRSKRRLAPEHAGRPPQEVARIKARGERVEEVHEELWLSYCGDTGSAVFDLEPRLFRTPVLVLECTFLEASRRRHAERYKHLHFADLVARADRFENRVIVLHHLSRRHRWRELRRRIEAELPALAPRVRLLGGEAE